MLFHQAHNSLSENNFNFNTYHNEIWEPHFHKNFELVYVMNGTLSCTVNGKSDNVKSGQYALCLPYEIHSYKPLGDTVYWVGVFSEDFVHAFAKQLNHKEGSTFIFECDDTVTDFFKSNLIEKENPTFLMIKSCLYAICDSYLAKVELYDKKQNRDENLEIIIDYVSQNFTSDIRLSDLSRLLGYDYHYISRYFNSVFNMTFTEFVNLYRLEHAVRILEESNKKIVEIAYESGFQSVRSFNNAFKQYYNISPSDYRKNMKK